MALTWGVMLLSPSVRLTAEDRVDYLTQIKPILRERCFACHGALKQQAGLRLDTVAAMIAGGDSDAVLNRGDASSSTLLERVAATDLDKRMPPASEGEPLSAQQLALLRQWIAAGASGPADERPEADPQEHWSFQPVVRPAVPPVENQAWVRNPVDAFLARQHQQHGLTPQAEAPRVILLRRLYFDLIGIPPTPDQITAFQHDESSQWFERTVEQLLDDPRHGQRWARHWMDVWRYSDWWGLGAQLRNSQKHIWHWRDWLVESLNNDTPYDEMVRLMLAADELHPNDLSKLRATGYLARNYFLFNRNQWMDETVEHVSKGFLGLTMNCAKCHDHKFDPLEQADFYRMRAFFEPYHVRLDILPGEADLTRDGIPRVYDGRLDTPTYRYIRGQENNPDKSVVIKPAVPAFLAFQELAIEPVSLPAEAWQPQRRPWVIDAHLNAAKARVDAAAADLAKAREKLAAAETPAARNQPLQPETATAAAVVAAQAAVKVAEAAVAVANAELAGLERRVEAMRAAWAVADNRPDDKKNDDKKNDDKKNDDNKPDVQKPDDNQPGDDRSSDLAKSQREQAAAAVRAEREVVVAKARHAVAVAEQALISVAADKRNAAENTLKAAGESLEKAVAGLEAEVKPTDQYSRFAGAQWTPTRFLSSGSDDPTAEFTAQSSGRRTALAGWITDRRNPLTARVAANHIWMRHMGAPLVPTVFDFGRNGAPPANPELLDWLASELVAHDWSMKHLHRLIVNSAAYRLSSSVAGGAAIAGGAASAASAAKDPDNRYWWRRVPVRLESQAVRDAILSLAGVLDASMGGPPVLAAQQAASTRRSLYFFHSNNERNLFLTTFDEAPVKDCYRREQSIVPQQALALVNSGLVLDASRQIAKQLSDGIKDDSAFIQTAFMVVVGIMASDAEVAASRQAMEAWQKMPMGSADLARANLVWALINHNDFVTVR